MKRLIAVACALASLAAIAYVLPADALLKHLMEARLHTHLYSLEVDGSAAFFNDAADRAAALLGQPAGQPEVDADARFSLKPPARCRADLLRDGNSVSAVVFAKGTHRIEGTELTALETGLQQICFLLGSHASTSDETLAQFASDLRAMKIDVAQSSLARFAGQVVFLIGNPAPGNPQLWLYKKSFLPARIRFLGADGSPWDVRFLDYGGPITGDQFPRQIEIVRGDALEVRFSALKADNRARLSDRLF